MASTDPFEVATAAMDRAAVEFAGVRRQCDALRLDNHQIKRRLERAEQRYQDLETKYVRLEHELAEARGSADRSRRAMLDHAGRTS